jgi:hypothetical protein
MNIRRALVGIPVFVFTLANTNSVWAKYQSLLSGEKVQLTERRVYNNYKLWECKDDEQSDDRLIETKRYLGDVVELVMDANPDVFRSEYAKSEFCLFVLKGEAARGSMASAGNMGNGTLKFSNFVDEFESDAEVAAVIAHELAHVTLQHYLGTPFLHPGVNDQEIANLQKDYFKELSKFSTEYLAILTKLASHQNLPETLKQSAQKHRDVFSNLKLMADTQVGVAVDSAKNDWDRPSDSTDTEFFLGQLDSLGYQNYADQIRQLDESKLNNALSNYISRLKRLIGDAEFKYWMEIEADLVGLRYYSRAGFDPNALLDLWVKRENSASWLTGITCNRPVPLDKAPAVLYPLKIRNKLLIEQSHPTHCWRAWRLAKEIEYLRQEGWSFGEKVNIHETNNRLQRIKLEGKDHERLSK